MNKYFCPNYLLQTLEILLPLSKLSMSHPVFHWYMTYSWPQQHEYVSVRHKWSSLGCPIIKIMNMLPTFQLSQNIKVFIYKFPASEIVCKSSNSWVLGHTALTNLPRVAFLTYSIRLRVCCGGSINSMKDLWE